ncbi:MAG: hypothetical protein L0J58_04090 [Micrococcaceae bacterium]|nr:hypothetical protein [Micrococcaceae bacterium]
MTEETGQSMILIIGYVLIVLLAVSATLAATLVNTQARKLLSVADSAVTAAADSFEVEENGEDGALDLRLSDEGVAAAAAKYVGDVGAAARVAGFALARARSRGDATTAVVRLSAVVRPPIIGWFVPEGIPISVESSARTGLTR